MKIRESIDVIKQILKEQTIEPNSSVDQILGFIQQNCKRFLTMNANDTLRLYRGEQKTVPVFIKEIRTNRAPTDLSIEAHNYINQKLKAAGFKLNRSDTMFTTGDKLTAQGYGTLYRVYPMDDFSFLWNPEVNDLYIDMSDADLEDAPIEKVNPWIDGLIPGYRTDNLREAIKSESEVLVKAPGAVLVNESVIRKAGPKWRFA